MAWIGLVSGDMDVARCGLDLARAFEHMALIVDQQEIGGSHFRPMDAIGIDEIAPLRVRKCHREMVANPFIEFEMRCHPQGCCKIDPEVGLCFHRRDLRKKAAANAAADVLPAPISAAP